VYQLWCVERNIVSVSPIDYNIAVTECVYAVSKLWCAMIVFGAPL
jgi:hypothetical protein